MEIVLLFFSFRSLPFVSFVVSVVGARLCDAQFTIYYYYFSHKSGDSLMWCNSTRSIALMGVVGKSMRYVNIAVWCVVTCTARSICSAVCCCCCSNQNNSTNHFTSLCAESFWFKHLKRLIYFFFFAHTCKKIRIFISPIFKWTNGNTLIVHCVSLDRISCLDFVLCRVLFPFFLHSIWIDLNHSGGSWFSYFIAMRLLKLSLGKFELYNLRYAATASLNIYFRLCFNYIACGELWMCY